MEDKIHVTNKKYKTDKRKTRTIGHDDDLNLKEEMDKEKQDKRALLFSFSLCQ